MAKQTVKIPKPTPEQNLAWTRAGVGNWSLVWDRNKRSWSIKKKSDVLGSDITFDKWESGQKSYETETTPGSKIPSDTVERVRATTDPLAGVVEQYGLQVVTDPDDGKTQLKGFEIDKATGKRTTVPVPYYLYLDSKNQIQISSDYDAVKSKAIADLKKTGQLNNFFQQLYDKKLISQETYNNKNVAAADFNAALLGSIQDYSKNVIGNREFGGPTQAPNFLNYVTGLLAGKGDGVDESDLPRREFQDISKIELNNFIDKIYLETIGRKPTEEQRASKLQELNKIVKQGIVSTKTVTGGEVQYRTKGGFSEQEQALKLKEKLKKENPLEYERRQAFDFMDQLQKIMSGGM